MPHSCEKCEKKPRHMADLPEKKVLKSTPDDNGEIDTLSALPDCVLLHILSLLGTKHAAATSILSTRWRNLFFWLPDIDFRFLVDNDATDRDRLFSDFINFANRVIQQRDKAPIRKIRLDVKYFVGKYRMALESLLNSVAAATSWSNVQILDIALPMDKTDERLSVSIPPGIFTSKTLVSLSLSSGVDWLVPNLVCLPNLKFLVLLDFRLVDEDSIRRFLRGCPVLETLILVLSHYASESEEGIEVKVVDISNPLLKNLILYWSKEVESEFTIFVKSKNLKVLSWFLKGQHKVTIDAPNLSSLSIGGHVLEVNIIQNLTSLDNAKVETGFLYYVATESNLFLQSQHALKLFTGLQNVKSFCLSEDILTVCFLSSIFLNLA